MSQLTEELLARYKRFNQPCLVLDFETFYGTGFSLSSLAYDEYCFDDKFQTILCAYVLFDPANDLLEYGKVKGPTHLETLIGMAIELKLPITAHNNFFDAMVDYVTVGVGTRARLDKARWACTMMLHKQFCPHLKHSLAAVAKQFGLPDKGTTVIKAFNKRRKDFSKEETYEYYEYSLHDAVLCFCIFQELYSRLTAKQKFLLCWHHWMYVNPRLHLDVPRLKVYDEKLTEEHNQRMLALADDLADEATFEKWTATLYGTVDALNEEKIAYVETQLQSNDKFAEILRWLGVDPPMKVSLKTGKPSYAFQKTNKEFTDLQDHEDELVATVVSARLGAKSSILRTRTRRLIGMGERYAALTGEPKMSVAIQYYGALTGRGSGTNKLNVQNLNRGSELRKCVIAPPGYKVVVADSSNIEMRIAHCISGQNDTIRRVRNNEDLYCWFASEYIFHELVVKVDKPKPLWNDEDRRMDQMRTIGKVAMLSLQYGAGPEAFQRMLWAQYRIRKSLEFCEGVVMAFRGLAAQLMSFNNVLLKGVLLSMCRREIGEAMLSPLCYFTTCEYEKDVPVMNFYDGKKYLGQLRYPNLRHHDKFGFLYGEMKKGYWVEIREEGKRPWYKFEKDDDGEWWPTDRIYPGGLMENICQFLANLVLTDVIFDVYKKHKVYPVLQVHDELVYLIKESRAKEFATLLGGAMCYQVPWLASLPLGCEVGIGDNYGEAK